MLNMLTFAFWLRGYFDAIKVKNYNFYFDNGRKILTIETSRQLTFVHMKKIDDSVSSFWKHTIIFKNLGTKKTSEIINRRSN